MPTTHRIFGKRKVELKKIERLYSVEIIITNIQEEDETLVILTGNKWNVLSAKDHILNISFRR